MRGLDLAAERRAAQDVLAIAVVDEVGEVRVAAGELLDGDGAVHAERGLEERGELAEIELFAGADRSRRVLDHVPYLARIRFATTILWTSSGPS